MLCVLDVDLIWNLTEYDGKAVSLLFVLLSTGLHVPCLLSVFRITEYE